MRKLAMRFRGLLRGGTTEKLDTWLDDARASGIYGMQRFAGTIRQALVYATELVPGKVGTIAGLFFGIAFGMGGIGAAVLGLLADYTGIDTVYKICASLPLIGLLTGFLPDIERHLRITTA